jgi:hypothetical protein
MRLVTDTCMPEEQAFHAVENIMVPLWKSATHDGRRHFSREYFYQMLHRLDPIRFFRFFFYQ